MKRSRVGNPVYELLNAEHDIAEAIRRRNRVGHFEHTVTSVEVVMAPPERPRSISE